MIKKISKEAIVILASLLLCAVMILSIAGLNIISAVAAENSDNDVTYLSDLEYASANVEKSRPVIKDAVDANGTKMEVKIEGSWYTFNKGLFTHTGSTNATATVTVTYNLENLNYNFFTAYVGLNRTATKGDGVRFNVGTSVDGKTWTWLEQSPTIIAPQTDAKFLTVDIRGAKWLQLWANRGTGNAHDHAVWADAKLTNSLDAGEDIKSLASYDEQIKAFGANADISNPKLESLILQREFVSRVGQYALKRFIAESEDNKVALDWLLNDLDSLREFMLGGTPFGGSYYNSLTVLAKLYRNYKTDLDDTRPLKYNKWVPGRTYGQLYRTMMFSVALTHDKTIGSYLQASRVENQSDPLRRYAIYRYMYETERFVATRDGNGNAVYETMNLFGSLKVEEMRWIMSNIIDDESIIWLNDYVQTRINASPGSAGNLHTPHSYVKYIDPNYNNPVFYANENYEYFNNLFAVDGRAAEGKEGQKIGMWDTEYVVPGGYDPDTDTTNYYTIKISRSAEGEAKLQKVWMNFRNKFGTGSVCGGISKSGCNIRGARGIPANVIGQPGHAAILYYSKDANGNGSWKIDNDVGGWVAATKNERHLLGWGNETWQRNSGGGGTVVFFHLAQECLNDYDNFVKAEEYTWLAKVYQGDLDKQEVLYEKALTAQAKNLDAWYGLVQTYMAKSNKTPNDFGGLAKRIGDTLYNHPLAMHCLFKLFTVTTGNEAVDAALTSPVFTTQLKTVELEALTKAKNSGSAAAKSKVSLILGSTDTAVADFAFDGENAGCIVWADTYSDGSFVWKYSLDGKKTWKEVTFNDGDAHVYKLSESELSNISTDNDIYVYIVGASPDNAYRIDVAAKPTMSDTLYANDWENRVIGVNGTYEWRYCTLTQTETETGTEITYTPTTGWISYAEASPDCSGDRIVEVRLKGTSKNPPSDGRIFTFTPDTDTADRKYVSIEYLTVVEFSTQSQDAKRPNYVANAIDGNGKTYWHTDYAKNLKTPGTDENGNSKPYAPAYLVIEIDVPRWISGLEFIQYQYNASFSIFAKDVTVYVSEDGKEWKKAATRENFENIDDLKVVPFDAPVYGQYVKLEMTALYETNKNDGVFTTVSIINLYEDTTKTLSPYGEEMPSLSEVKPSGNAFAGLGETISEEEALIIGGEPTDEPEGEGEPEDSNDLLGLWIALAVVGVVLIGAATVFVLYKLKIIKLNFIKNTNKGSKKKTTYKSIIAKVKAKMAESKVSATKPKASATEPKVNDAKAKTSVAEPKSSTAKPKTSAVEPKVSDTKPKASTTESKSSTAKAKTNTTETKASTAKAKTSVAEPKANAPKAKTSTAETKASTPKAKTSATETKASAAKPKKK